MTQTDGVKLVAEGASKFIDDLNKAGYAYDEMSKRFRNVATGRFAGADELATLAKSGKAFADEAAAALERMKSKKDALSKNVQADTPKFAQFFTGFASGAGEAAGLNTAIGALTGGWGALGLAAGSAAIEIGKKAVGAMQDAAKAVVELAAQTAPIQGLQAQFANMSQTFEGGSAAMLAALQKGSAGMISNRDLMRSFNDAAALVNVQFAQRLPEALELVGKAAFATGSDFSFLMQSLVTGVGRVSPMIIDNLKIQVGVEEATQRAAEMFHKEADALTKVEQQTAITDLALEKLRQKFGDLPSPAETAAGQMQVLNASMQNIEDTAGQFLLPAFNSVLKAINQLLFYVQGLISEGGALYPVLVNIGAVMSLWADGFAKAVDWVVQFADNLDNKLVGGLGSTIDKMYDFGVNIVTNLATGIINATGTALVTAMNAISSMLTWWLAPGSPPKVAPDLDKWGIAAFTEYLHGMTEADFAVLKGVQGPLQKVLEGPEFADLSKSLAKSLAGDDRGAVLDALRSSSKVFGDEIATLAERQFALADATDAVAVAEKAVLDSENALKAAREASTNSQKKVSAEVAKYNELLRKGASRDVLDAQLARINAAEQERTAAMDNAEAAEDAVDAAKERLDATKEQQEDAKAALDLQQQIVDQMTTAETELTPQTEAERAAAKAKGGGVVPRVPGLPAGVPVPDVGGAIGNAIDEAKEKIIGKFKEMWGKVTSAVGEAWDKFKTNVGEAWENLKDKIAQVWDKIKEKAVDIWENTLVPIWNTVKEKAIEVWEEKIIPLFESIVAYWNDHLKPMFVALGDVFKEASDKIGQAVTGTWQNVLLPAIEDVWTWVNDKVFPLFVSLGNWFADTFGPVIDTVAGKLSEGFLVVWTSVVDALTQAKDSVLGALVTVFNDITRAVDSLTGWLTTLAQKIASIKLPDWMQPGSPTPWEMGLRGVSAALREISTTRLPELTVGMAQMQPTYQPRALAPSYALAGAGGTAGANVSLSFGDVVLNNDMDWYEFREKVQRAVKEVL